VAVGCASATELGSTLPTIDRPDVSSSSTTSKSTMSNPSQLLLLCDHIKLSLLERQRAISLNLTPNPTADGNISRSLESLREGIESLSQRSSDTDSISKLRLQYNDLSLQFHGEHSLTADETISSPNDPSLQDDFARAKSRTSTDGNSGTPQGQTKTSNLKAASKAAPAIQSPQPHSAKNVRFRDDPSQDFLDDDAETRAALFPSRYTDDDRTATPDPTTEMDNQQIHAYHQQVIAEQDDQLDQLGESIGRQRHLSMAIGDELDGQAELLEDVERGVDRHQGRLDGAKRRLTSVGRKASQNWGMTTIVVLIIILVLLIIVLK